MADPDKTGSRDVPDKANWAADTAKSPDDFDGQDEPMTDEQAEHLKLLSKEANLPFTETLTRGEAQRRIDALQRRTGNKP